MGDQSVYKDYIQNLPLDVSHYPVNYSDTEQKYLQGSDHMIIKISVKKIVDKQDYDLLVMAVPELANTVSYEEFKLGKIWASTRAYDLAFTDG
jgi:hypothetical protein